MRSSLTVWFAREARTVDEAENAGSTRLLPPAARLPCPALERVDYGEPCRDHRSLTSPRMETSSGSTADARDASLLLVFAIFGWCMLLPM